MQQTINKEIREYNESMFIGLSMRQFIFSLRACTSSVITYFVSYSKLGNEISSWLCIAVCVPFIAFGYLRMNGMYFEQIIMAIIRYIYTKETEIQKL